VRVRLGTIVVSDHERKALAAHVGQSGKCRRADVRQFYLEAGEMRRRVVVAEYERRIEPRLPFSERAPTVDEATDV